MKKPIKQFAAYTNEADKVDPYHLVLFSHNDPHDPNKTGPLLQENARKMNLKVDSVDFQGAFLDGEPGKRNINTFPVDKDGAVPKPDAKGANEYAKPIPLDPDNTLIMMRGIHIPGVTGNQAWLDMAKTLEYEGYTLINSTECHLNCSSKWYNQILFERHGIRTPKTVIVAHKEGSREAFEKLDTKFPLILKTSNGSRGVGVVWVESLKSLEAITQLLYRENEYIDILLQEYIKIDYDVRVIVVEGDVVGAMKRPVPKGEFRSNVAQGSEPISHELTDREIEESIRAAKSVGGSVTGVDFMPAEDREGESPYFIEVNSTPGLVGIEEAEKKRTSVTQDILKKYFNRTRWTNHSDFPDKTYLGKTKYNVKNDQGQKIK
jgi:RimK family alpha-L-glutamate ligase